mmetsp:Transcript_10149/g.22540  ORF Transcript_10149/g.22540 Transcript_10149/m.22540 type:complete len:201 (-) Transcript_10149:101-703(-)
MTDSMKELDEQIPTEIIISESESELKRYLARLKETAIIVLGCLIVLALIDIVILVKGILNLDTAEYLIGSYGFVIVACAYLTSSLARDTTTRIKNLIVLSFLLPAVVTGVSSILYIDSGLPAEFTVFQICITLLWINLATSLWIDLTRIQKLREIVESIFVVELEASELSASNTIDSISTISTNSSFESITMDDLPCYEI